MKGNQSLDGEGRRKGRIGLRNGKRVSESSSGGKTGEKQACLLKDNSVRYSKELEQPEDQSEAAAHNLPSLMQNNTHFSFFFFSLSAAALHNFFLQTLHSFPFPLLIFFASSSPFHSFMLRGGSCGLLRKSCSFWHQGDSGGCSMRHAAYN